MDKLTTTKTTAPTGGAAALLAIAVEKGKDFPIETLERLFALHREEQAAQARRAYYEAMAAFQAMCPRLDKVAQVSFSTTRYNFAPLGYIADTIRESMQACGLSYRFDIADSEKGLRVTCIVTHTGGHSERTEMTAPADTSGSKNAIQARGSTVTYLQRYTLLGALGLVTGDEDTDGRGGAKLVDVEQAAVLAQLVSESGSDRAKFLAWGGCSDFEHFPASKFAEAVKTLQSKIAKQSAATSKPGQKIAVNAADEELPL